MIPKAVEVLIAEGAKLLETSTARNTHGERIKEWKLRLRDGSIKIIKIKS